MNWPEKIDIKTAIKTAMPHAQDTPHSQAWAVPNETDLEDPPLGLEDGQLTSLVLALWREYILHDEVLSAISLLENAPYRIRHSKIIEEALEKTKSTIDWIDNKESQRTGNSPLDPNGIPLESEVTNPLPHELNSHVGARYKWITDRLSVKRDKKILDLGCIDGTMTNRWGLSGYKVTGVDLSTTSINTAKRKAEEFHTNAEYVNDYFINTPNILEQNSFDFITCSDVYEHILNPVEELLKPAFKMCKTGGKMLLVTPHGAWMRGQVLNWSPPWTWVEEGLSWIWGNSRAHVIAPTIWSVTKHLEESGWWIKNAMVMNQPKADVVGQSNVCVEAIKGKPPTWPGKNILIVEPEIATEEGMRVAKDFALLGNRVEHVSKSNTCGYEDFVMRTNFKRSKQNKIDVVITDNEYLLNDKTKWKKVAHLSSLSKKTMWEIIRE